MYYWRIWPDYTIQSWDEEPYGWKSDDYLCVCADDEEEAIRTYKELYG